MRPFNQQFTLRGIIVGLIGCIIVTASSVYMALKLGALPWPIFFVVLFALFSLRLIARMGRKTNINEANVSATMMSAGAMVAGGLAFTIPAIYILQPNADLPLTTVMLCAICGVALGCVGTALFRQHFIVKSKLPYPIGTGAAQTLKAANAGGRSAILLFASALIAGLVAVARDLFVALPQMLLSWVRIPGVSFGIICSPMALAMGFLIGPLAALVWVLGGLIGDFGIVVGGTQIGLWGLEDASGIKMSLGIGVMIGCGVGLIVKTLLGVRKTGLPAQKPAPVPESFTESAPGGTTESAPAVSVSRAPTVAPIAAPAEDTIGTLAAPAENTAAADIVAGVKSIATIETAPAEDTIGTPGAPFRILRTRWALVVAVAVLLTLGLTGTISPPAAILLVALVWLAMVMSAQCTGQAGLNPMEVFGIIVLLVIALFAQVGGVEALLVAAITTVACGFVGDMTNDFKAGHILNTNPKAQWLAECIGGFIGAAIGALVLAALVAAYGPEAFGPDKPFVAAQATAVAAMIGSIPSLPAFLIGLAAGLVLYVLKAPVITLGLGIYLPFSLSLTVAVGALVYLIVRWISPRWSAGEEPTVIASGLLAGESITGVIMALMAVSAGLGSL
ncbi:MAG: OPT/YSL family transporter [Coriobacteriales bacterium]|jgi:uncharacterized oligopeptide transporter (OPT) family protein|nr:OPT/YSL family transporter [Coriobacteriales bacterium]